MAENNKKSDGEDDERLGIDDIEIHDIRKFTWTDEDIDGLVWLDDHEYTGTVPPSS
jgi:hypothetical protein